MESKYEELKKLIDDANSIVFFGGAGVSTESNIPDFRSTDGLYNLKYKYPPETMLSKSFFYSNPEEFYKFYRDKVLCLSAKPNKAHLALSKLESKGKLKAVVTQNIDGLHQLAGSNRIFELHGSVHRNYCLKCGAKYDADYIEQYKEIVPKCSKCGGMVRPDVVLYEEGLDMNILNGAVDVIRNSDLLIIGGTSLVVYPAAGLITYHQNNNIVLINKDKTSYDKKAKLIFNESIGKVLFEVIGG